MSLVPSMCTLSQRRWVDAWEAEQAILDRLGADRDTRLPHVVESREWGVLRWTSGRPEQAAETGTAVAETFAVLSPDATSAQHRAAARALRSSPPVVTVLGKGLRRSTLLAAASFGVIGVALGLLLGSVTGAGALEIGRATSELQSRGQLVCRLLLEKKNSIEFADRLLLGR